MKSVKRLIVSTIAAVGLAGTVAIGATPAWADTSTVAGAATADAINNFESQAFGSGGIADAERAKFEALSTTQKLSFIELMQSPDPLSDPRVVREDSSGTSRGGSPQVLRAAIVSPAALYNVHSWWKSDFKFLGITVGQHRQDFRYVTDARIVKSIQSCDGGFSGWSGLWSLDFNNSSWLEAGGTAVCQTNIRGSLIWKGNSLSINKRMSMRVNGSTGITWRSIVNV